MNGYPKAVWLEKALIYFHYSQLIIHAFNGMLTFIATKMFLIDDNAPYIIDVGFWTLKYGSNLYISSKKSNDNIKIDWHFQKNDSY